MGAGHQRGTPRECEFRVLWSPDRACLLGNVAKRVDGPIAWDAANLKVTNLPEANRYVRTEYRVGWEL